MSISNVNNGVPTGIVQHFAQIPDPVNQEAVSAETTHTQPELQNHAGPFKNSTEFLKAIHEKQQGMEIDLTEAVKQLEDVEALLKQTDVHLAAIFQQQATWGNNNSTGTGQGGFSGNNTNN